MSTHVFTVEEVDALIPELERRVGVQLALGVEIEGLVKKLARETGERVASLDPDPEESRAAQTLRLRLRDCVALYEQGWRDIHTLGAVVKDTSMGLLDFYGRLDGKLVWLCWRFGETQLGFYHDLDAGFGGRRPLGVDTRARVLN